MKQRFTGMLVIGFILCLLVTACARQVSRKPVPGAPRKEPTISIYVSETGQKKQIKLEDYIAGVVAAEMEPTWPVNALAAQAILARTFTMENIQSGRVRQLHGTDVSTNVQESQAYNSSRINDRVRQAVKLTRGKVVTYNGRYIKAWFNACDGGVTASAAEGLGYTKTATPYVRTGVKDNCLSITKPENRLWEKRIPIEQVRQAVKKVTGKDAGAIESAKVVKRGLSGRVEQLQLGNVTVSAPALRLAIGSELMRSTLLTGATVKEGSLVLSGRGYGHGVGMCQWGAKKLAEKGSSPEDIIKFYYKNIQISKLWE